MYEVYFLISYQMRDRKPFRSLQSGHRVLEFELDEVSDPRIINAHLVVGIVNNGDSKIKAIVRLEQLL
jgi:hypothetical protein